MLRYIPRFKRKRGIIFELNSVSGIWAAQIFFQQSLNRTFGAMRSNPLDSNRDISSTICYCKLSNKAKVISVPRQASADIHSDYVTMLIYRQGKAPKEAYLSYRFNTAKISFCTAIFHKLVDLAFFMDIFFQRRRYIFSQGSVAEYGRPCSLLRKCRQMKEPRNYVSFISTRTDVFAFLLSFAVIIFSGLHDHRGVTRRDLR